MRIPISCSACHHDFSAPPSFVGRKVKCPECGKSTRVSDAGGRSSSDDEGSRGSRSRRRGESSGKGPILVVVGIAAILGIGIGLNNLPDLTQMVQNTVSSPGGASPGAASSTPDDASAAPPVTEPVPVDLMAKPPGTEEVASNPPPEMPAEPEDPEPPKINRNDRSLAADEVESELGQKLLADIRRVVLIREGVPTTQNSPMPPSAIPGTPTLPGIPGSPGDPAGAVPPAAPEAPPVQPLAPVSGKGGKGKKNARQNAVDLSAVLWSHVQARSKYTVENLGLEHAIGKPKPNSPVLAVTIAIRPFKQLTDGTQEITITAELTCENKSADSDSSRYAVVWKEEQVLGTVSRKSAQLGKVPDKVDEHLGEFFGKFRAAYRKAVRHIKEAEEAARLDSPQPFAASRS